MLDLTGSVDMCMYQTCKYPVTSEEDLGSTPWRCNQFLFTEKGHFISCIFQMVMDRVSIELAFHQIQAWLDLKFSSKNLTCFKLFEPQQLFEVQASSCSFVHYQMQLKGSLPFYFSACFSPFCYPLLYQKCIRFVLSK